MPCDVGPGSALRAVRDDSYLLFVIVMAMTTVVIAVVMVVVVVPVVVMMVLMPVVMGVRMAGELRAVGLEGRDQLGHLGADVRCAALRPG